MDIWKKKGSYIEFALNMKIVGKFTKVLILLILSPYIMSLL